MDVHTALADIVKFWLVVLVKCNTEGYFVPEAISLAVFSACDGIRTDRLVLTAYFPVLAWGMLGNGSWHKL